MRASSQPGSSRNPRSLTPDTTGASKADVLELTQKLGVRFMRLQFTDILGINKNVEIPSSQFEKALAGDIMFDGSSIEGFVRIEESDMLLRSEERRVGKECRSRGSQYHEKIKEQK